MLFTHYHYVGNINIKSTNSLQPTKAFIMLPYAVINDTLGGFIYKDTVLLFNINYYNVNYSVRLYPVKAKNIHINNVVVNAKTFILLPVTFTTFKAP